MTPILERHHKLEAEKRAAERIIRAGLAKGWHGRIRDEEGVAATSFTGDFATLAAELQATSMETVEFFAPPARDGDRFAFRGAVVFVWGNGEDVVADFSDNLNIRKLVGQFAD